MIIRLEQRAARAAGAAAILFGALDAWLFFPGVVDSDSVNQYETMRAGAVHDWFPPIMARLWQALEAVGLIGTGPIFLLQLGLFWLGLALLAAGLASRGQRLSALAVIGAAFVPPVMAWMMVVINNAQLTAVLTAATGLVGHFRLRDRPVPPWAGIAAALLVGYAILVRANGIFPALPLLVLLASGADGRVLRPWPIAAAAVAIALFLATPFINGRVLQARAAHAGQSLLVFDITGTAHHAAVETLPGLTRAQWAEAERRSCYTPYFWDKYDTEKFCPWVYHALEPRDLVRDWIAVVGAHPLSYAEHRLRHWNTTLRFLVPRGMPNRTADESSSDSDYRIGSKDAAAFSRLYTVQEIVSATPVAWPGVYLALALALLVVGWRTPPSAPRTLGVALAASGGGLLASFAVVSVASDMRYHLWGMTATLLAAATLFQAPGLSARRYASAWGIAALAAAAAVAARLTLTALPWPLDAS